MKSSPTPRTDARRGSAGFTLAEVLAALLLMAIIIPISLEGMGLVSRAAIMGQRKTAAMRVAERVLNEQLAVVIPGQAVPTTATGTEEEGGQTYTWSMTTAPWPQDTMTQMTVHVTFISQGNPYVMSLSTLYDPNADVAGTSNAAVPTAP